MESKKTCNNFKSIIVFEALSKFRVGQKRARCKRRRSLGYATRVQLNSFNFRNEI